MMHWRSANDQLSVSWLAEGIFFRRHVDMESNQAIGQGQGLIFNESVLVAICGVGDESCTVKVRE